MANGVYRKIYDSLLSVTQNFPKSRSDNPDNALVYSFFGSIFLDLKEFEWAFRCFQFAKEQREKIIGGDTLDTAAIYNNMGVVAFYMESFLPSKNYLNLAYEITRSILGLTHPRTLYIKSNLAKLSQLSFNKEVVFKTLNQFFSGVEPIIRMNHGRVDKYIGDAVMAIFGEPIPDDNHPQNAVKCAYEMLKKVEYLMI